MKHWCFSRSTYTKLAVELVVVGKWPKIHLSLTGHHGSQHSQGKKSVMAKVVLAFDLRLTAESKVGTEVPRLDVL